MAHRAICIFGIVLIFLLAVGYCPFVRKIIFGPEDDPFLPKSNSSRIRRHVPNYGGWKYFEKTASLYQIFEGRYRFDDCRMKCKTEKSRMASIHSDIENEIIYKLATANEYKTRLDANVWIGIFKIGNVWMNMDGTPFDYTNWAPKEPNDYSEMKNCAHIYSYESLSSWNAHECNFLLRGCACKVDLSN